MEIEALEKADKEAETEGEVDGDGDDNEDGDPGAGDEVPRARVCLRYLLTMCAARR